MCFLSSEVIEQSGVLAFMYLCGAGIACVTLNPGGCYHGMWYDTGCYRRVYIDEDRSLMLRLLELRKVCTSK